MGSVFDAFGITSSSSGSTHHTMMSSTTCASSGSRRCVYWARPGPIRPRSFVNAHCRTGTAPLPVTRTDPRCETSKTTARSRHARCSSSTLRYWIGMSQPPNSVMRASSARCSASSGLCLSSTGPEVTARLRGLGLGRDRRSRGVRIDVEVQRLGRSESVHELGRRLESVLHEQVQVVALVEHLDPHVGELLAQPARLAVLLGHESLVQRRDLDVDVLGREVEVRRESLGGIPLEIQLEGERPGLVLPRDPVEVEQFRELPLRVVREADLLVRQGVGRRDRYPPPPALAARPRRVGASAGAAGASSWMLASSCSTSPARGTMFSTPWPWRTTSTMSSPVRTSTERVPSSTSDADARSSPRWSRRYSIALRAVCRESPASSRLLITFSATRSRYE